MKTQTQSRGLGCKTAPPTVNDVLRQILNEKLGNGVQRERRGLHSYNSVTFSCSWYHHGQCQQRRENSQFFR